MCVVVITICDSLVLECTFCFRADTTLFEKAVEMKFTVASGKTQWFKGQITKYDGLTGKYRVYCPCDGETVYVYPSDNMGWSGPIASNIKWHDHAA